MFHFRKPRLFIFRGSPLRQEETTSRFPFRCLHPPARFRCFSERLGAKNECRLSKGTPRLVALQPAIRWRPRSLFRSPSMPSPCVSRPCAKRPDCPRDDNNTPVQVKRRRSLARSEVTAEDVHSPKTVRFDPEPPGTTPPSVCLIECNRVLIIFFFAVVFRLACNYSGPSPSARRTLTKFSTGTTAPPNLSATSAK